MPAFEPGVKRKSCLGIKFLGSILFLFDLCKPESGVVLPNVGKPGRLTSATNGFCGFVGLVVFN